MRGEGSSEAPSGPALHIELRTELCRVSEMGDIHPDDVGEQAFLKLRLGNRAGLKVQFLWSFPYLPANMSSFKMAQLGKVIATKQPELTLQAPHSGRRKLKSF